VKHSIGGAGLATWPGSRWRTVGRIGRKMACASSRSDRLASVVLWCSAVMIGINDSSSNEVELMCSDLRVVLAVKSAPKAVPASSSLPDFKYKCSRAVLAASPSASAAAPGPSIEQSCHRHAGMMREIDSSCNGARSRSKSKWWLVAYRQIQELQRRGACNGRSR